MTALAEYLPVNGPVAPPPWPKGLKKQWSPIATIRGPEEWFRAASPSRRRRLLDEMAIAEARERERQCRQVQCSATTATWTELMFSSTATFNANASTSVETSLLAGANEQPQCQAFFFWPKTAAGKTIRLWGKGVLGTTGTPTIIFQVRLGTASGSGSLSGASVGVSAAITTASGVTNQQFEFGLDLTCTVVGIGTGNSTLLGAGWVMSPGGFASPFIYAMQPTTPPTATWTSTFDCSVTNYFNVSTTWGTSNASNTVTLKNLFLAGLN